MGSFIVTCLDSVVLSPGAGVGAVEGNGRDREGSGHGGSGGHTQAAAGTAATTAGDAAEAATD